LLSPPKNALKVLVTPNPFKLPKNVWSILCMFVGTNFMAQMYVHMQILNSARARSRTNFIFLEPILHFWIHSYNASGVVVSSVFSR
jgi:hypothetical protein